MDREIQALIKLEHKNVVKYCCSWHENHTPDGCEFSSSEVKFVFKLAKFPICMAESIDYRLRTFFFSFLLS